MTTTIAGAKRDTPATLARARKTPSIGYPPLITTPETPVEDFTIFVNGKSYLIGPAIEGDPEEQATIDGTATITLTVRDPRGELAPLLADEQVILRDGVSMLVDGDTYMIQSITVDETTGTLVTIVFQDVVAWQLGLFTSFVAFSRDKYTRAEAALKLVDEASQHPLPPLAYYIPELTDAQRTAAAGTSTATRSTKQGTGASATGYTVKGAPATATQRANIDGALGECKAEGATARVMVATIMAATQESGITTTATVVSQNGIQAGMFQQDSNWGPISGRRDPALSTSYFLGGWTKAFGSVKASPGDISADIETVQVSGLNPQATYGQWQTEAEQTVLTWLGTNPGSASATADQPFEFTRGTKDSNGRVTSRESSWQATGEWAQTVNWRRWAQHNTFFFISDDELRQQAPGLQIDGDEPWLLAPPAYTWNPDRSIQQCTIRVLKKRWGLDIGARVLIPTAVGPASGSFLVEATDGYRQNPELTVTLNRPATKKPEPAGTTASVSSTGDGTGAAGLGGAPVTAVRSYPLTAKGTLIGTPYVGTHAKAFNVAGGSDNWESENAIDIGVPIGTGVLAVDDGTIGPEIGSLGAGASSRFAGLRLHLVTSNNEWYYAHLSKLNVVAGQVVKAGHVLGWSGSANGVDHLHIASENGNPQVLLGWKTK